MEALEKRLEMMESRLQQDKASTSPVAPTSSSRHGSERDNGSSQTFERAVFPPGRIAGLSELRRVEKLIDEVCAEVRFLRIPSLLDQLKQADALSNTESWWQGLLSALVASTMCVGQPCLSSINDGSTSSRHVAVDSWAFFRNAYAVLPELLLGAQFGGMSEDGVGRDLGPPQAVMAMATFMRLSADTRTTALLLSIAIRIIQQHSVGPSLPSAQAEESYSRLFWAAFILDMEHAMNTGQSSVHHMDPVSSRRVDLVPAFGVDDDPTQPGSAVLSSNPASFLRMHLEATATRTPEGELHLRDSIFTFRAELARIQRRIAIQLSHPTQINVLDLFESEIATWTKQLPLAVRPDLYAVNQTQPEETAMPTMDLSVALLHFTYYSTLVATSWASLRNICAQWVMVYEPRSGEPSPQPPAALIDGAKSLKALCRNASRATIRSLAGLPTSQASFPEIWYAKIYYLLISYSN